MEIAVGASRELGFPHPSSSPPPPPPSPPTTSLQSTLSTSTRHQHRRYHFSTIMALECLVPTNPPSDWSPSTSFWFHRRHNALDDCFGALHRHAQRQSSESSHNSPSSNTALATIGREKSNGRRAIQKLASCMKQRRLRRQTRRQDLCKDEHVPERHQPGSRRHAFHVVLNTSSRQSMQRRMFNTPTYDVDSQEQLVTMSSQCTRTGLQNESIRKAALRAVLIRRIGSRGSYLYHLVHFAGIGDSTASHRHQMPTIPKRGTCNQAFQFALPRLGIHP
jgi:hypothetical protein